MKRPLLRPLRWTIAILLLLGSAIFILLWGVLPDSTPIPLPARLAQFPRTGEFLHAPARVRWSEHAVPFIEASDEDDLPFMLGMVHAHLRLGQMELLKRIAQGRLSEMGGPFLTDFDIAIRTLNLGAAVPAIEESLPPPTRRWLLRYVEGINSFIRTMATPPPEWALLGIEKEPWTLRDVLTIARLAAADVNWLFWSRLLALTAEPHFSEYWTRVKKHGLGSAYSLPSEAWEPLGAIHALSKSGSNAFVVAGRRSASGGSLLASDPHVGISVPPLWCAVGWRGPEGAVVGFTIPGIPFVLIGRNEEIAWGGTNLLSISSALYSPTQLSPADIMQRQEHIRVRLWPDKTVTIRTTPLGPIISDAPLLKEKVTKPLILWWRGHTPSDEMTTFLKVQRAKGWQDFRSAFQSYGVSGQNFLYADKKGSIGQLIAARYSAEASHRYSELGAAVQDLPEKLRDLRDEKGAIDLPSVIDPSQGYLVSTNNLPAPMDPPLSFMANSNDRFERLSSLLLHRDGLRPQDLMQLQRDVMSPLSHRIAQLLLARLRGALDEHPQGNSLLGRFIATLNGWDGEYALDSEGATVFQVILYEFATRYYAERYGRKIADALLSSTALYDFLQQDLEGDRSADLDRSLIDALISVANDIEVGVHWGDLHRLSLQHMLGGIPVLGRAFRYGEVPASGSSLTVQKTAHTVTARPHRVRYGANARFVTDMADLDGSSLVLLGGNDGWIASSTSLDQAALWHEGRYLEAPLSSAGVARIYPNVIELQPRSGESP